MTVVKVCAVGIERVATPRQPFSMTCITFSRAVRIRVATCWLAVVFVGTKFRCNVLGKSEVARRRHIGALDLLGYKVQLQICAGASLCRRQCWCAG